MKTFASLLVTATLVAPAYSQVPTSNFNVRCGNFQAVVKEMFLEKMNLGYKEADTGRVVLIPSNVNCTIEHIEKFNIGAFCEGKTKFAISDSLFHNGERRFSTFNSTRLVLHPDSGGIAQSQMRIERGASELIMTVDSAYNTSFFRQESVYIPNNDLDSNCQILAFQWSDGSGC